MFSLADKTRKENVGDGVHLRGLVEFSNICKCNCKYCGLRKDNNNADRYRILKDEIIEIIKGLGLSNTRYSYLSSMIDFIEKYNDTILEKDNDELIELIANNVSGASYKVAQCCVLYMRGYYCGIMPVDSGMKDVELPCIGFEQYGNAIGHDILRKQLQEVVKDNDMEDIITKYGYDKLDIPNYNNVTWWAHLVLIYFKRHYCNKHKPDECPLANKVCVSCKCKK